MNAIQTLLTEHIDIWTAADTEKKSGRGRSSANAASVYGIRKLRELILDLAVRGKLVPQDINDEPASELLKLIQAEKAKLIADGKIKKDKPLPPVTENEQPFDLPPGWAWARNGFLFNLRKGRIPKNLSENNIGLPYLDIEALDRGVIRRYSDDDKCPQSTDSDILVVCDGSRSGLILNGKVGIIGSTLSIIDTPVFIQPFVRLIFRQGYERLNSTMKGAAIPHLDTQNLVLEIVGLPPLAEQHRIVAKVDELMVLCDQLETQHNNATEAHEKLVSHLLDTLTQSQSAADFRANWQRIAAHFDTMFTTESSIDALKQTLLQLAVMGKLVPQDPNDEPAKELINRIYELREQSLAGKRAKAPKTIRNLVESEIDHDIPDNWAWCRLGDLVLDFRYGTSRKCSRETSGVPVLRIPNIQNGCIDSSDLKFTDMTASEYEELRLREGDLLLVRSNGSESLVGRSAVASADDERFAYAGYLVRARIPREIVFSPYLHVALSTPSVRIQIEDPIRTTSGVKNINTTELSNLVLSLPPHAEQHLIVNKVDELMALCEQLQSRIAAANQLQQKLADVLVEQAVT